MRVGFHCLILRRNVYDLIHVLGIKIITFHSRAKTLSGTTVLYIVQIYILYRCNIIISYREFHVPGHFFELLFALYWDIFSILYSNGNERRIIPITHHLFCCRAIRRADEVFSFKSHFLASSF